MRLCRVVGAGLKPGKRLWLEAMYRVANESRTSERIGPNMTLSCFTLWMPKVQLEEERVGESIKCLDQNARIQQMKSQTQEETLGKKHAGDWGPWKFILFSWRFFYRLPRSWKSPAEIWGIQHYNELFQAWRYFIQLSEIWLSSGPKSVLNIHLRAILRKEGLHQSFKNRSDEFCRNGVCCLARICWRCCNISILSTKVDQRTSTVEIPAASQKQLTNPVVFPYALKVSFPKWLIHNFLLANSIYQIGYQDSG